jgi:hypothetical protein
MPSTSLRTVRDDASCLNDEVARRQAPLPPITIFGTSRWHLLSMLHETIAMREAFLALS